MKQTKQGLESSLYASLEFGFKACERGQNLESAKHEISQQISDLVKSADNCPSEVLRIGRKKQ